MFVQNHKKFKVRSCNSWKWLMRQQTLNYVGFRTKKCRVSLHLLTYTFFNFDVSRASQIFLLFPFSHGCSFCVFWECRELSNFPAHARLSNLVAGRISRERARWRVDLCAAAQCASRAARPKLPFSPCREWFLRSWEAIQNEPVVKGTNRRCTCAGTHAAATRL